MRDNTWEPEESLAFVSSTTIPTLYDSTNYHDSSAANFYAQCSLRGEHVHQDGGS